MKTTALSSDVLIGQGGSGSFSVSVPNPAPGVGQDSGVDAILAPVVSGAEAGAKEPATYPLSGSSNEPMSQYSTQGPIPKG